MDDQPTLRPSAADHPERVFNARLLGRTARALPGPRFTLCRTARRLWLTTGEAPRGLWRAGRCANVRHTTPAIIDPRSRTIEPESVWRAPSRTGRGGCRARAHKQNLAQRILLAYETLLTRQFRHDIDRAEFEPACALADRRNAI